MAFDLRSFSRNRCVGWVRSEQAKAAGMKDVPGVGKGVYSGDLTDDDGNVSPARIKVYTDAGVAIDPADVRPITVNDLPAPYSHSAKSALEAYVDEWNRDAKPDEKITANELMWRLVLNARLQDEANETVKRHRPVTDKAKERAYSTLVKAMRDTGKTQEQIDIVLSSLK